MDDRNLEKLARGLGRDAAGRIDPEVVAQQVLRRLRDEPEVVRPWYRRGVYRLAAAAVLVITTTTIALRGRPEAVQEPSFDGPALTFAFDGLSDAELGQMLDSLETEAPMVEVMQVGFYDLDEGQLQDLLEALED